MTEPFDKYDNEFVDMLCHQMTLCKFNGYNNKELIEDAFASMEHLIDMLHDRGISK